MMTPAERVNPSSGSAAHTIPFLLSRHAPSCHAIALATADAGVEKVYGFEGQGPFDAF